MNNVNMQVPAINDSYCPQDCLVDFFYGAIIKINEINSTTSRRGIFSKTTDANNIFDLMQKFRDRNDICNVIGDQPASSSFFSLNTLHSFNEGTVVKYEIRPGDIATFGPFQIVFDEVSPEFNTLLNSSMTESQMRDYLNSTFPGTYLPKFCLVPEDVVEWYDYGQWCKKSILLRQAQTCNSPRWPCDLQNCNWKLLVKWHLVAPAAYNK